MTDAFGRPEMRTHVGLVARRGAGTIARFAAIQEADIPLDTELGAAFEQEAQWCRSVANRPGTVVATAGMDPRHWRSVGVLLTDNAPTADDAGDWYEVGHLARPHLEALPGAIEPAG